MQIRSNTSAEFGLKHCFFLKFEKYLAVLKSETEMVGTASFFFFFFFDR